jgi:transposase
MGTRVHYPEEIKWEVIKLKQAGKSNKEIMEQLGIKHKSQIKTWMKWFRTGQRLWTYITTRQWLIR